MMSRTTQAKILLFVILLIGSTADVFAADGDLDLTFDGDGIVTTDNGLVYEGVRELVVQPDGKIIAIGYSQDSATPPTNRAVIVRYNPNGSIDSNFGTSGKVIVDGRYPGKPALQPDGKIVFLANVGATPNENVYVARLNPDGSFDSTFNSTGTLILDLRGTNDSASVVRIRTDGKILIGAGSVRPSPATGNDVAIVRLNPDGSLDTTFDGDGKAFTPITPEGSDYIVDLAIQPNRKFVAAGRSFVFDQSGNPLTSRFLVVRFNEDGSLDTSFDGDGKAFTQVGPRYAEVTTLVLQCDGKIVVAGTPTSNTNVLGLAALVRYNSDGSLDSSFANGGIALTGSPFGPDAQANDIVIQADGKIVIGAMTGSTKVSYMSVGRYKTDGEADSTFSTDGWNNIPTSMFTFAQSHAVAIQPDGKIVVGGYSLTSDGSIFQLARFDASSGPLNCAGARRGKIADFDGDGKTDLSVFRNGTWFINSSSLNNPNNFYGVQFGLPTDKLTPADFDGDGKTDIAVFRDGVWYLLRSQLGFTSIQFGAAGDIPIPADYDGDGLIDVAFYRGGMWNIVGSQVGYFGFQFGLANDKPVPADFDGDGITDAAVYRDGVWYLLRSQLGFTAVQFGAASDRPVVGDYDGDARADLAVYRLGDWYVLGSTQGFYGVHFGIASDVPVPGDYDADGKTDIAVYRDGTWYMLRSELGFTFAQFGVANDRPIPSAFVP